MAGGPPTAGRVRARGRQGPPTTHAAQAGKTGLGTEPRRAATRSGGALERGRSAKGGMQRASHCPTGERSEAGAAGRGAARRERKNSASEERAISKRIAGAHTHQGQCRAATWLILPVVICLSQRLSHACLSISDLYCETANGSLNQLWFI